MITRGRMIESWLRLPQSIVQREADMIIALNQQWKSRTLCLAHLADESSIGFLALLLCL